MTTVYSWKKLFDSDLITYSPDDAFFELVITFAPEEIDDYDYEFTTEKTGVNEDLLWFIEKFIDETRQDPKYESMFDKYGIIKSSGNVRCLIMELFMDKYQIQGDLLQGPVSVDWLRKFDNKEKEC